MRRFSFFQGARSHMADSKPGEMLSYVTPITFVLFNLVFVLGCASQEAATDKSSKTIPLNAIFVTHEQPGTHIVAIGSEDKPYHEAFQAFQMQKPASTNIFLVKADSLDEAVEKGIRFRGISKINGRDSKDKLWLVAFLGQAHSSPPRWQVIELKYTGKSLVLTLASNAAPLQRSRDISYC